MLTLLLLHEIIVHVDVHLLKYIFNIVVFLLVTAARDVEALAVHLNGLLGQVAQWLVGERKQLLMLETYHTAKAALAAQLEFEGLVEPTHRSIDVDDGVNFVHLVTNLQLQPLLEELRLVIAKGHHLVESGSAILQTIATQHQS